MISASGEWSASRSPASATRRTPTSRSSAASRRSSDVGRHVAGRGADDDRVRPQLDREPQRLERVLGDARDGAVADAGQDRVGAAGTRSTMTTVGTGGLARLAGELGLELRAHELRPLRGGRVLGERRRARARRPAGAAAA